MKLWNIPKMWKNQDCWIIGGGSSISEQFNIPKDIVSKFRNKEIGIDIISNYMSFLHNKNVIGVNDSFLLGDWIDVLFFGDWQLYIKSNIMEPYTKEIQQFNGLKVTVSEKLSNEKELKYLLRHPRKKHGLTERKSTLVWNVTSGGCAINLATRFGVKRIFLLGYDLYKMPNGIDHWNSDFVSEKDVYSIKNRARYRAHLNVFNSISKDAALKNIEIINVSKHSKIRNFRKMNITQIKKKYYEN